ncbi:MAG: hypothetical protein NVSMB64_26530 [Candidatus Velthaea sp.]
MSRPSCRLSGAQVHKAVTYGATIIKSKPTDYCADSFFDREKAMIHAFIDTNIFLRFYASTNDRAEELQKLTELIEGGLLTLYVPKNLQDEFYRNRDNKLNTSIDELNKRSYTKPIIPRFLDAYDESRVLEQAHDSVVKAHRELVSKAIVEAKSGQLTADQLMAKLFQVAGVLPSDRTILDTARIRLELRNPPSKPNKENSLGDRLNWEHLLARAHKGMVLHVVSDDGDFASALDKQKPNQFLVDEWSVLTNGAALHLHNSLRTFFNMVVFDDSLQTEKIENDDPIHDVSPVLSTPPAELLGANERLIDDLISSGTFAETHRAIKVLRNKIQSLPSDHLAEILDAAENNNQIAYIRTDDDVNSFLLEILNLQKHKIPSNDYEKYLQWLSKE